jgi:hypothetical protein
MMKYFILNTLPFFFVSVFIFTLGEIILGMVAIISSIFMCGLEMYDEKEKI